jgi:protein-S-isoprenylcysteine O-methyltransferase Ste14
MTLLEVVSRIRFEENLMLEYFGDQYRGYVKTTGRLLPRVNIITTSVIQTKGD